MINQWIQPCQSHRRLPYLLWSELGEKQLQSAPSTGIQLQDSPRSGQRSTQQYSGHCSMWYTRNGNGKGLGQTQEWTDPSEPSLLPGQPDQPQAGHPWENPSSLFETWNGYNGIIWIEVIQRYSLVPDPRTAQTRIRLVKLVNSVTKFRRGIDKFH